MAIYPQVNFLPKKRDESPYASILAGCRLVSGTRQRQLDPHPEGCESHRHTRREMILVWARGKFPIAHRTPMLSVPVPKRRQCRSARCRPPAWRPTSDHRPDIGRTSGALWCVGLVTYAIAIWRSRRGHRATESGTGRKIPFP